MRRRAASLGEFGRDAGTLGIAAGASGALVYIYFALASHNLSADDYGLVVILWSATYVAAGVLFRPVEQLLARSLAHGLERGQSQGHTIRVACGIQAALLLAAVLAVLLARGPLEDDLLDGNGTLYLLLILAMVTLAANYVARGFLAGRRQFDAYTGLLVIESVSRVLFALAVAVGIGSGANLVAAAIAAAPLAGLIVIPAAVRRHAVDTASPADAERMSLSAGGGFALAVLLVMLAEQIILTTGPLFVRASVDAAAAGFIFNVLMVARAPLLLFQAVATTLLPHLAKLHASGEEADEAEFSRSVRMTVLAVAMFAAVATVLVLAIGPPVMEIAFGGEHEYDRAGLAIVAVGMGLYLIATTLNQAVLARGQAGEAAVAWALSAGVFIAVNLIPAFDEARRVEVGFAAAGALLCLLLYRRYRRGAELWREHMGPGSADELEARLAAAEEAS